MPRVFISYCREDQDAVKSLAQDIACFGYTVWLDSELAGGHAWWDQILGFIHDSDVFLFALSPESLESVACKSEYKYACALGKTVFPVVVADGVLLNLLPPELSRIQHTDYKRHDKQSAIAVLKHLIALPKSPPLPQPLPQPPPPPLTYLGVLAEQIETTGFLSLEDQSVLVLKLKEQLGTASHREDVRTLLTRLRRRGDLYARIADEIDTLLSNNRKMRGQPNRPLATATTAVTKVTPQKTRSALRLLLAPLCAIGAAVGSVQRMYVAEPIWFSNTFGPLAEPLVERHIIKLLPGNRRFVVETPEGVVAFALLWPLFTLVIWFLIPFIARILFPPVAFGKRLVSVFRHAFSRKTAT